MISDNGKSSGGGESRCGREGFARLGDLLGEVDVLRAQVKASGVSPQGAARAVAGAWCEAVGPAIAENAEPLQLRAGRLTIATSSSAWAQTLQLMAGSIVARLNELLQEETVEEIVFRHAGWTGGPSGGSGAGSAGGAPELSGKANLHPKTEMQGAGRAYSEEQRAALEEVGTLDLDPVLRDKIAQAMQASFVREQQD